MLFLVGNQTANISDDKVVSSTLLKDLVDTYGAEYQYTVPEVYYNIIGNYINFLHDKHTVIQTVNKLLSCLKMANFFQDDNYFSYLMTQAFDMWNTFSPHIDELPVTIRWDVFTYSPIITVPDDIIANRSFLKSWISINKDKKQIVINKHDVYHCNVTITYSDPSGKSIADSGRITSYFGEDIFRPLFDIEVVFYSNQVTKMIRLHLPDHGDYFQTNSEWSMDGVKKYQCEYTNNLRQGLCTSWLKNGEILSQHTYDKDKLVNSVYPQQI